MVTQIVQPEGEVTNIGYDDLTGDRTSQEDGRGMMSRVNFQYYLSTETTNGAMPRLLKAVVLPSTATLPSISTQVKYDTFGNVDTTWTPRGAYTAATNDAIGRTIATASQNSAAAGDTTSTTLTYDLADRVTKSVTFGPAIDSTMVRQWLTVQNSFSPEGQLLSVSRTQSPDTSITIGQTTYNGVGTIVTKWRYDNLGRKIAEIAPDATPADTTDNPVELTSYDRAGNVESVQTRRHNPISGMSYTISMTYDVLGRLKTRTVPAADYRGRWQGIPKSDEPGRPPYPQYPNNTYVALNQPQGPFSTWGGYTIAADVATFDYDSVGNMIVADNADAHVRRVYYPNGQLHFDTLFIRRMKRDGDHTYGLEYLYDRNGRLLTLKHPDSLSIFSDVKGRYQTRMQYDPYIGVLSKVISPRDSEVSYTYDERGQVAKINLPRGAVESRTYDQDGNITRQLSAAWGGQGNFHDATMSYDLRGKMLALGNNAGAMDSITTTYTGLGQLAYQRQITHVKGAVLANDANRYDSKEWFTYDPMGNRLEVNRMPSTNLNSGITNYSTSHQYAAYENGTGRLLVGSTSSTGAPYRDTTEYDEAGNILFTTPSRPETPLDLRVDRASFYGADGQLRAVDYRKYTDTLGVFEEYRYDALGRRVLVEARRGCRYPEYSVECSTSYVRRTVWDGSRELYEIQMPDDSVRTTASGKVLRENDTDSLPHMASGNFDPNQYFGRVAYTYGLATDQPVIITRLGFADSAGTWPSPGPFTIVPLWTMRGYADTSYFAETGFGMCTFTRPRCALVGYPAEYWMPAYRFAQPSTAFHGSLLVDKADASGQLFRRNRYYDPGTGRFTQEDPIGLAGGLNAYGFAGGDPVNFSDPFGLCPIAKDGIPCTADYAPGVKVSSAEMHAALDAIAMEADKPLLVYGGDRDRSRNASVGGAPKSSHLVGEAADVIFEGSSKRETLDILYHSQARKDFGVRLLYHQNGSTLPEHSHLDLQQSGDITEQKKGSKDKYVPLKDPLP
jgi:RHS repeat-associated protein